MADDEKAKAEAAKAERRLRKAEASQAAAPEFKALTDTLDENQMTILREYGLITTRGLPVATDFNEVGQDDAGKTHTVVSYGPKINVGTLRRFFALDKTPDHRWTSWIFEQAGGGAKARAKSEDYFRNMVDSYTVRLRAKGMSDDEVKAEIERTKGDYRRLAFSADEDILQRCSGVFGWTRDFPGYSGEAESGGRYQRVEDVMTAANAVFRRLRTANKALAEFHDMPVETEPDKYPDVPSLKQMVLRVERAEAALYTRSDLRIGKWPSGSAHSEPWKQRNTVYADDNLSLIVPLTYAASIEYGYGKWAQSNRADFERTIAGPDPAGPTNVWLRTVKGMGADDDDATIIGILTFNVPVPAWASVKDKQYDVRTLSRLQLRLPARRGAGVPDIRILDEDADEHKLLTPDDVIELIRSEVGRSAKAETVSVEVNPYDETSEYLTHFLETEGPEVSDNAIAGAVAEAVGMAKAKLEGMAAQMAREQTPRDYDSVFARLVSSALNSAAQRAAEVVATARPGAAGKVDQQLNAAFDNEAKMADAEAKSAGLIDRGADVYQTPEEAEAVVSSFDAALKALVSWVRLNRAKLPDMYQFRPPDTDEDDPAPRTIRGHMGQGQPA